MDIEKFQDNATQNEKINIKQFYEKTASTKENINSLKGINSYYLSKDLQESHPRSNLNIEVLLEKIEIFWQEVFETNQEILLLILH